MIAPTITSGSGYVLVSFKREKRNVKSAFGRRKYALLSMRKDGSVETLAPSRPNSNLRN